MPQKRGLLVLWLLAMMIILLFLGRSYQREDLQTASWDKFLDMVEGDEVASVTVEENVLTFVTNNRIRYETIIPPVEVEYLKLLRSKHVRIKAIKQNSGWFGPVLYLLLPLGLVIFLLWIFRKVSGRISNAVTSFAKLGTKQVKPEEVKTTFADVAGCEEAKADLEETVHYLQAPKVYEKIGARAPKGVLLIGPPGTGKTLLARATAGEAKVAFFQISGSEFVEMFVGVGAARVRELFEQARKASPCIIFIDEIDAVGRQRSAGLAQGNEEREQTLNQLLKEMDGFLASSGIVMLAATNMPQVLDRALLRPGRFDRHVIVPRPDLRAREAILRVHVKKLRLAASVDLAQVAQGLPTGMSGADIENVVNEAALRAVAAQKEAVDEHDLSSARDRVLMGPARRSMVLSPEERRMVAYHEAGHAVIGWNTPSVDPVYRVTIVPRGVALGVTMMFPERDTYSESKERLLAEIDVCFGGRVAEELVIKSISTGAANDLERATKIALSIVRDYGMSGLGERVFGSKSEVSFFGQDFGQQKDYSEATAQAIDEEVKRILEASKARVNKLLLSHIDELKSLAEVLLEKETVEREELKTILGFV